MAGVALFRRLVIVVFDMARDSDDQRLSLQILSSYIVSSYSQPSVAANQLLLLLINAKRRALPFSIFIHNYGVMTLKLSGYGSSLTPSFVMTLTNTPLKSTGIRLLSSSVHIRRIFMPCSNVISGW